MAAMVTKVVPIYGHMESVLEPMPYEPHGTIGGVTARCLNNLHGTDADHAGSQGRFSLCCNAKLAMLCSCSDTKDMPTVPSPLAMLCSSSRIWDCNS